MNRVITIDGNENNLKNEVCRIIAERLDCYWVSTEVFYRGIAYIAVEKGLSIEDPQSILNIIFYDNWEAKIRREQTSFEYLGKDVTEELYKPEVTNMVNQMREEPKIRKHMLNMQRDCAELGKDLVAGGADCGSVVFPEADVKFFLQDGAEGVCVGGDVLPINVKGATAEDVAGQILKEVG